MITISIDDQIEIGKEIVRFMQKIDPEGDHYAYSDIDAALALIHEKHPDVVWLDVEMPGRSGLELSIDIKTTSPMTNIIFVTGHEKFAYQSIQLHPSGFVLKPVTEEAIRVELDNLRFPVEREQKKALIRVQCFGNFEVFDKEGQLVTFQRTREKEVLAYLIDRRGALCSIGELSAGIFEEGTGEQSQKTSVRVFYSKLKTDLEKIGAGEVLVKKWNAYGVDCSRIDCDYYDFLEGNSRAVNSFLGEYMTQYSWAEMTLGELQMKREF